MNREIKFRAWDKVIRGFINGFNMIGFSTGQGAPNKKLQRYSDYWDLDNIEIMQYTGLKDKNGKEIYEGDIVVLHNIKAVINWDDSTASFYAYDEENDVRTVHLGYVNLVEVIGNIYENPELFKEAAKDE